MKKYFEFNFFITLLNILINGYPREINFTNFVFTVCNFLKYIMCGIFKVTNFELKVYEYKLTRLII